MIYNNKKTYFCNYHTFYILQTIYFTTFFMSYILTYIVLQTYILTCIWHFIPKWYHLIVIIKASFLPLYGFHVPDLLQKKQDYFLIALLFYCSFVKVKSKLNYLLNLDLIVCKTLCSFRLLYLVLHLLACTYYLLPQNNTILR